VSRVREASLRLDDPRLEPLALGLAERRVLELGLELRDPVAPALDVARDPVDRALEVDDLRLLLEDGAELREAGDGGLHAPDGHAQAQRCRAVLLALRVVVDVGHVAAQPARRADRALHRFRELVVVVDVELDARAVVLCPRRRGERRGRPLRGVDVGHVLAGARRRRSGVASAAASRRRCEPRWGRRRRRRHGLERIALRARVLPRHGPGRSGVAGRFVGNAVPAPGGDRDRNRNQEHDCG